MIRGSHITLYRGDTAILHDAAFTVSTDDAVGIVGDNGAGKTSLLHAIAGDITLESGVIQAKNSTLLVQDNNRSETIEQYYTQLEHWQLYYALSLAEVEAAPETPLTALSGGQRTLLGIAAILVRDPQPEILLLDEPTNNLDSAGIQWLKATLRRFTGTILLVSHDRALLDAVCSHIIEIRDSTLTMYTGNFSDYKAAREQEHSLQQAAYEAQQEQKKALERQLRTQQERATSAKRKPRKDNDKMLHDGGVMNAEKSAGSKLRAVKAKLAQLEETARPTTTTHYRSSLHGQVLPHQHVVSVDTVSYRYEPRLALNDASFTIRGPVRLHLVGENGSGKSTLLKLLARKLPLQQGDITYGANIATGYFSQDADQLHGDTALAVQISTTTKAEQTALFENARALGLLPHELQKPVATLSRGQRAKAALLELLMNDYQLLLLDEPTNHLDIRTQELLENTLQRYKGAIIFASHDTYFARKIATRIMTLRNK